MWIVQIKCVKFKLGTKVIEEKKWQNLEFQGKRKESK